MDRTIEDARRALKKAGHQVIDVKPDQALVSRLCHYFLGTAFMNHSGRVSEVNGEFVIPEFLMISLLSKFPNWIRPIIAKVGGMIGQPRVQELMNIPIMEEQKHLL